MSHLTPSFDRFPIPSAVPAVQWRRQWDLEDAARYRLAAEAARAGKQSANGYVALRYQRARPGRPRRSHPMRSEMVTIVDEPVVVMST